MEPLSRSLQMIKANLQTFARFELVQESELKFPGDFKVIEKCKISILEPKKQNAAYNSEHAMDIIDLWIQFNVQ